MTNNYCLTSINANDVMPGCKNFRWYEFLHLNQWGICVIPESDMVRGNLIRTASVLQQIRTHFNKPISITSGYRPQKYNELIGGAAFSSHRTGRAVDFIVHGMHCDNVRAELEKKLIDLDIRMEKKPGSNWVHIDLDVRPGGNRYFRP
jgi:hypothetical protein